MGKQFRKRKTTVYCSVEGEDEAFFLEYLKEIYSDLDHMSFPDNPMKGGNSDKILDFALKYCHYDRSFAWVDEDIDLSANFRKKLAKCWHVKDEAAFLTHPFRYLQKILILKIENPF